MCVWWGWWFGAGVCECVYVGVWVNTCKALRTVRGKNNNSSNLLCVSYSSKCFISFKSLDAKIICGVIILSFQMRKQSICMNSFWNDI